MDSDYWVADHDTPAAGAWLLYEFVSHAAQPGGNNGGGGSALGPTVQVYRSGTPIGAGPGGGRHGA
jgi:hypothetical protein